MFQSAIEAGHFDEKLEHILLDKIFLNQFCLARGLAYEGD